VAAAERPGAGGPSVGARYALDLAPADVGSRVVVRRRLPEGQYGDVLGELERWPEDGSDEVVVRDRHGVVHRVPRADVVAAKTVPPAPPRR
jgi:hypothetical protein